MGGLDSAPGLAHRVSAMVSEICQPLATRETGLKATQLMIQAPTPERAHHRRLRFGAEPAIRGFTTRAGTRAAAAAIQGLVGTVNA